MPLGTKESHFLQGFWLFFSLALSMSVTGDVKTNNLLIKLPEFGFDRFGHFSLQVIQGNPFQTQLFFGKRKDYVRLQKKKDIICRNTDSFKIYSPNGPNATFEINVSHYGVYYPVILNCQSQEYSYSANYSNSHDAGDSRDQVIPGFLIFCAVCHLGFVIFWCKSKTKDLHQYCFAMIPFLKAIALIAYASTWSYNTGNPQTVYFLKYATFTSKIAYETALIAISIFAILGCGTYRRRAPIYEFLFILLLSFAIALTFHMMISRTKWFIGFCLAVAFIGVVVSTGISNTVTLITMFSSTTRADEVVPPLQHLLAFSAYFLVDVSAYVLICVCCRIFKASLLFYIMIREIFQFTFNLMNIYYFYRQESPVSLFSEENILGGQKSMEATTLTILKEPFDTQIAVLSNTP